MTKKDDRFELEQQILNCWSVVDDIKTVAQMEDLRELSDDELANALLGLQTLYQMKFEQLFDIFEKCVKNHVVR